MNSSVSLTPTRGGAWVATRLGRKRPRFPVRFGGIVTAIVVAKTDSERVLLDHTSGPSTRISLYDHPPSVDLAVAGLIEQGKRLGVAAESIAFGAGNWTVFSAPHIRKISHLVFTQFRGLHYVITADGAGQPAGSINIVAHVHYTAPIVGQGWLSAAGRIWAANRDDARLRFDSFWIDAGMAKPSPDPRLREQTVVEKVISVIGKVAFLEQLATFPVEYFSQDLCVFQFRALSSHIAARRF